HARVMNHGSSQAEPLSHAFRESADRLMGQLIEPCEAHRVLDRLMPLAASQAVGTSEEVEVFIAIDVGIGAKVIGHEAEAATNAIGVVDTGKTVNERVDGGRQIE